MSASCEHRMVRRAGCRRAAEVALVLVAGAALAVLTACSSDSSTAASAGGEDFPNSATAAMIGQHLAASLSASGDWNAFDSILDTIPASAPAAAQVETTLIAGQSQPDSLGTPVVLSGTIWSDTSQGLLRSWYTSEYLGGAVVVRDTFAVVWNDAARDTVAFNELLLWVRGAKSDLRTGREITYATLDTNADGSLDSCRYRLAQAAPDSTTGVLELEFDAGAGGSILTLADNRITVWRQYTLRGADTLAALWFADADSARGLLAFGQTVPALVDFFYYVNPDTGAISRAFQWARMVYVPGAWAPATVVPIGYRAWQLGRDGGLGEVFVVGPNADSTFKPGDTLTIVTRERAEGSLERSAHFTVALPMDPAQYSRASLIRFAAAGLTFPSLTHVTFTCVPERAVAAGEALTEGIFTLTGLADDIAFSVEGSFDANGISGVYRDARGWSVEVRWGRDGTVIVR